MTFAVSAPDMTMEELSLVRRRHDHPRPAGPARASAGSTAIGGADREIRVELDPVKLDSYGITAQR